MPLLFRAKATVLREYKVERKRPVISSAVEKSNNIARSMTFCTSLTLRDFSATLVAPNCALSKPCKRGLQLYSVAASLRAKATVFREYVWSKEKALSFRAQSRNLTIKHGRILLSVVAAPRFLRSARRGKLRFKQAAHNASCNFAPCRFSSRKYYSFARVRVVERKNPVISSAVEKSNYMARSTPFCRALCARISPRARRGKLRSKQAV